jgi:hypothetical protein
MVFYDSESYCGPVGNFRYRIGIADQKYPIFGRTLAVFGRIEKHTAQTLQAECFKEEVSRSKKRSATTGHSNSKGRPTTQKDRDKLVEIRERPGLLTLTIDEVSDHFRRTIQTSEWSVVPGLHCLRHSFISACASKGLDQRIIDEWVGHQTDEQRRRYRHLYPSVQQAAIKSVFG